MSSTLLKSIKRESLAKLTFRLLNENHNALTIGELNPYMTRFRVSTTLKEGANKLLLKWQQIADKL